MTHADSLINTPEPDTDVALVVDLDGTLVRSDLLIESAFVLAHQRPQSLLKAPGWLKTGKGRLKSEIARRVELGVADLPYNEALIDFLRAERQRGRTVILATAANEKYARQVADHLRVFDHVLASTDRVNLSGQKKLDAIRQHLNGAEFDYAGDSDVDRVLWRHSRQAILVNANARLERQVRDEAQVGPTFAHEPGGWRVWARALRVHQWMKNALIFLPLIAAHNYTDLAMLGVAVLAFIAFSVLASSVYLLNDLIDLGDDRRHPTKRERPFACGRLPLIQGVIAVPALLITAAIIALFLPPAFGMVMLGYYALTLAYSLALKRLALIDVLTLAGLYTVRIVAGGVATGVPLSFWLLALSMSIFLSLAMAKRCTELMLMARTDETPRGARLCGQRPGPAAQPGYRRGLRERGDPWRCISTVPISPTTTAIRRGSGCCARWCSTGSAASG